MMLREVYSHVPRQQCQDHLVRYVHSCPRQRGHHESEQRAWLQAQYSHQVSPP